MERLLHYVWKYKMYPVPIFTSTTGQTVSIIDPGIHNTHAGPDFFNAKIKIDDTVWVGNVEIHLHASDWCRHGHDTDRVYDSVILHVVGESDRPIHRTNGERIPQIVLQVPEHVRANYAWLLGRERDIACQDRVSEIDPCSLSSWMDALLSERLERKTQDIFTLLTRYSGDWNEVFYILLCRNFGFGTNSDAFELLAKSLPLRCLQKHRDNQLQVEALFFGQAGMLHQVNLDPYYRELQREYLFLSHKFDLHPLDDSLYKSLRMRPANFPHVKMAQLAALWAQHDTFFSAVLETGTINGLRALFRIAPSVFWQTHYHFDYPSVKKEKIMGENALNILLINTVVPILFAYGVYNKQPEYTEKAWKILELLPPENNRIIEAFRHIGFPVKHAGGTQALIQLKRTYCENKKCLYCRIGFKLLQKK